MATVRTIMAELKSKGSKQQRKTYKRHGLPEDRMFGVKISDLKIIAKGIKRQQQIALDLYDTGNLDAMYLAGLVADGSQMSKKQLKAWAKGAEGLSMISNFTVPWVAVESPFARDLATSWIDSKNESVACCGWCTYAGIVATTADAELDLAEIEDLLKTVVKGIHAAPNLVRLTMNGFVISVGSYVRPLLPQAKATAEEIGEVYVDMGDTACKVPLATAYIRKVEAAGKVGTKRKTMKC